MDDIKELTSQLVSFRTTRDNPEELKRCADFIEGYFREYGVYVRRFEKEGIPSVYISLHETVAPTLMFNAHFDVVPGIENLYTAQEKEGRLIGRGVIDDKGPLAVVMVLLKELSGHPNKPNVAILATGDEESGGKNGAEHALEQGITSEFAVVLDGGTLNQYVTKAKGILALKITAKGEEAHGSRPWEGDNAIEKLMEAYMKIRPMFENRPDAWSRTINPSIINAGDAANKVPGTAEMILDIRYTDAESSQELLEEVKAVCGEGIEVEVLKNTPVWLSDDDNPHLEILMDVSREVMGDEPSVSFDHGGSDAGFFMNAGIPSVVTTPLGGNYHSDDEFLDINTIGKFYEIMRKFVLEVCST